MFEKNPNKSIDGEKANLEMLDYIDSNRKISLLRKGAYTLEFYNISINIKRQSQMAI